MYQVGLKLGCKILGTLSQFVEVSDQVLDFFVDFIYLQKIYTAQMNFNMWKNMEKPQDVFCVVFQTSKFLNDKFEEKVKTFSRPSTTSANFNDLINQKR